MKSLSVFSVLILVLLFLTVSTGSAYAYLDPGTGSYIFQLLAAGALGGIFAIKTFWRNISSFFVSKFGKSKSSAQKTPPNGK